MVDYVPADYVANTAFLFGVSKIHVNAIKECDSAFDGHLEDSAKLARRSRSAIRIGSYMLLVVAIITIIIGVLFVVVSFNRKNGEDNALRSKVALVYWFAGWL